VAKASAAASCQSALLVAKDMGKIHRKFRSPYKHIRGNPLLRTAIATINVC